LKNSYPLTTRKLGEIIAHAGGAEISVARFLGRATTIADELPRHTYVVNLATSRYEFLLGLCAAIIAGQCTLLPPNRQQQTLQQLRENYADCYLFGETDVEGIAGFYADPKRYASAAPAVDVPVIPRHQLCAIAFTSGSTGASTPHPKYWDTIHVGAQGNARLLGLNDAKPANMLATVPPQHMWGLEMSILLPLFANIAISHETPLFPQDIRDALAALPEPRILVSSPIHLDAFLRADIEPIRISRVLSATAPLSAELARQIETRFGAAVTEVFGCSEAGSLAARSTASETLWRISDVFDLQVRDDRINVLAPHLPERVVLHDRIEMVGERQFRWLGRDQDMINIAGKRGSLAHLNHKLTQIPGVVDGVIFLPREDSKRLAGLVVAPGIEPSAILKKLKEAVEPAFLPRPFYSVPMLPRQETGKLARKMVLELFASLGSKANDDAEPADNES
jgi:acyl-coenzyme A synthetase/AMP-(fatty) acid ligase